MKTITNPKCDFVDKTTQDLSHCIFELLSKHELVQYENKTIKSDIYCDGDICQLIEGVPSDTLRFNLHDYLFSKVR